MEKDHRIYCQAIKKNGKPMQNGGPIIDNYCKYHKHLRNKDPSNDPNFLTTMN